MNTMCDKCSSELAVRKVFVPSRAGHFKFPKMYCDPCGIEHRRDMELMRKYEIGYGQYHAMLEKQGGKCAICGSAPMDSSRLSVDHCHKTGAIRGLLCGGCNIGISLFRDDPELAAAASRYLAASQAKS